MNMNKLISEIKKKLGLVGHLSKVIQDKGIRDIIYMSLDEFNRYSSFPVRVALRPYVSSLFSIELPIYDYRINSGVVEIPIAPEIVEMCKDHGVIIKDLRVHPIANIPIVPHSVGMKQDMMAIQYSHIKANNYTKPVFKVKMPNTLIIENFTSNLSYYQNYMMEMRMTHPRTLSTIDIGLERWFEELCRYNVAMVLFNNDLRFLNVDIGSVRVELNIENFQSAESDKKELLNEIRARAASDALVFQVGI